ncbi:MAG: LysR family transcriptional regulator, partial [Comamonadaceae bacterium]
YRSAVTLTHRQTRETRQFPIAPRMLTDSLFALRSAALAGLGACIASSWLVTDDIAEGRLVQLAPDWAATPLPVYIVYPHARFYPSRLLRFVARMRDSVPPAIAG